MTKTIEGTVLFSITPISADESIDFTRWKTHLDDAIEAGIRSVVIFGSTGANGYFSEAEKMTALETVVRFLDGRASLMVGIGAMTTAESVRLAKHAANNGADAVLVVPINYWRPTEREIIHHYETVAAASNIPMWLYNNPPLTGIDLTPALVAKLASNTTVVGMKDSSGDLTRVFTVPKITGGAIKVGIGQDTLILEAALENVSAWFTGLANICPKECVAFWDAAKSGDAATAYALARRLYPLSELGGRYGIIRIVHSALEILGRPVGPPRLPLLNVDKEADRELRSALTNFWGSP